MRLLLPIFGILFANLVFATPYDSIRTERTADGTFVIHQVEEKETLYSLSKRYKSNVDKMVEVNGIVDYKIKITQVIRIPIGLKPNYPETSSTRLPPVTKPKPQPQTIIKSEIITSKQHIVNKGETLYSISKSYGLKVEDLMKLNNLETNAISIGQVLNVSYPDKVDKGTIITTIQTTETTTLTKLPSSNTETKSTGFRKYSALEGENVKDVAKKLKVSVEDLKKWNKLKSNRLVKDQEIYYQPSSKGYKAVTHSELKGSEKPTNPFIVKGSDGVKRTHQEGIASVIYDMATERYLALHRTLPAGTQIKVRNIMNNQSVYVKVVGRLPNTGENTNIILRLSQVAYDKLGILDAKSRVEISYIEK